MSYDVYPTMKDKYAIKGAIPDVNSVRSLLAHIFPAVEVSIKYRGVQIAIDTWENMDKDMKTMQESFPLLSFSIELVLNCADDRTKKWRY